MSEKNLTFTSQGLTNIQLYKFGAPYEITLYYKKGNTTATKYTFGADGKGPAISLSDGQSVEFYGTNNKFSKDKFNYYSFNTIGTGTISLDGNIMSLIGINKLNIINNYEFYNLFGNCDNIVTAERLQLPAKKLAPYCYAQLFQNCDNLVTAPQELPATSLAQKCYLSMFRGCSSLDTPPVLKATTLVPYCYEQMFYECISLVNAPKLKAHELREGCYKEMFKGCTSLHTLSVKFTQWKDGYGTTSFWLGETSKTGVISIPKALVDRRGDSFIPDTWTTRYNDNDSEEEEEVAPHGDDSPSVVALEYFAGNGLALDNYTFSLTGTVLSAGTGISIENNIVSLTATIPTYTAGTGLTLNDNEFSLTADIPNRIIASNDEQQANLVHLWLSYWDGNHDNVIGNLPLNIIGNNVSVHADNPNTIIISANINPSPSGDTEPDEDEEEEEVEYWGAPDYISLESSWPTNNMYSYNEQHQTIEIYEDGWLRISKRGKNETAIGSPNSTNYTPPDTDILTVTRNGETLYSENDKTVVIHCKSGDEINFSVNNPNGNGYVFVQFAPEDDNFLLPTTKGKNKTKLQVDEEYVPLETGWLHVKFDGIDGYTTCNSLYVADHRIALGCDATDEWFPIRGGDSIKVYCSSSGESAMHLEFDQNVIKKSVLQRLFN